MPSFIQHSNDEISPNNLLPGEGVLGHYENDAAEPRENIIITTKSVIIRQQDWIRIRYDELEKVLVNQEKALVDRLILKSSSQQAVVVVRGGKGRLRDAWGMMRFLKHRASDVSRFPRDTWPCS
jgi:bifunctional ADP-heptose synthase (sugar kinase/adenylyltransferase)